MAIAKIAHQDILPDYQHTKYRQLLSRTMDVLIKAEMVRSEVEEAAQ